jgi:hypothetical protein
MKLQEQLKFLRSLFEFLTQRFVRKVAFLFLLSLLVFRFLKKPCALNTFPSSPPSPFSLPILLTFHLFLLSLSLLLPTKLPANRILEGVCSHANISNLFEIPRNLVYRYPDFQQRIEKELAVQCVRLCVAQDFEAGLSLSPP